MSLMIVLDVHFVCLCVQLLTVLGIPLYKCEFTTTHTRTIFNIVSYFFSMVPKTIPHVIKRGKADKVLVHALLPSQ